jgi:hypothetical protein
MWEPIDLESINSNIEFCNTIFIDKPKILRFWDLIKIKPEKWNEKTMGEEGGGFWVVAIIGKKVIYYNDIEEGYNLSTYTNYGEIDHYNCGQEELHHLIINLFDNEL